MTHDSVIEDIFLLDKYADRLRDICAQGSPAEADFTVAFADIYGLNPEKALAALHDGKDTIAELSRVIRDRVFQMGSVYVGHASISGVIDSGVVKQSELRHVWSLPPLRFISVKGIVSQIGLWEKQIEKAVWRCTCGNQWDEDQETEFMRTPRCDIDKCRGSVSLVNDDCRYIQVQWVKLQESPDDVEPGEIPMSIQAKLRERLVGRIKPGDRVELSGWVQVRRRKPNDPNPLADPYLEVNHIEFKELSESKIVVTGDDKNKFMAWVSSPNHFSNLIKSTAPSLHGLENEKTAIILQRVGGVAKNLEGEKRRGDIHVFLVGDPGEGKSQLLRWGALMNPRSIETSGKGSTAAGLTATVLKDEETGMYSLAAGALVLADGGLVIADEFDKMRPDDRSVLHTALEDQFVPINKAGINTKLNSRTSLLAACNPKDGMWNNSLTLKENLKGIPTPLLTRFDLIFVVSNQRSVDDEMKRVQHMINTLTKTGVEPVPYQMDELKKFYVYARGYTPQVSPEASAAIMVYYESVLHAQRKRNTIMITPRDLEGMLRLTEASAKLHLRILATVADAEIAIKIKQASMMSSSIDPATGMVDANIINVGMSKSSVDMRRHLLQWAMDRCGESIDGTVTREEVTGYMVNNLKVDGLERAKDILESMKRDTVFFEPRPGRLKVT